MTFLRSNLFAFLTLLLAACSSDSKTATSTPGTDAGTESDGATPGVDSGLAGANLRWRVTELSNPSADAPAVGIAGVKVCVDAHPEVACAETDADGYFTLKHLPADSQIVLVVEKDGFVPALKPIETSNVDMDVVQSPIQLTTPAQIPTNLGLTLDATKGGISFFAIGLTGSTVDPVPGVRATLTPASGQGPYYFDETGVFDPALTATTYLGGAYFNVDPGDYKLSFEAPPGLQCAGISTPFSAWGYPVSNEPAVRFPVRGGYVTGLVGVLCTGKRLETDGGGTATDGGSTSPEAGPTDAGNGGATDGG